MIMWDKKKAVDAIMQKRKAGGGPIESGPAPMKMENVKDEDGMPDGKHLASQDIMAAMHEKSPEKLMQALANFMDIHSSSPHSIDPRDGEKV